MPAVQVLNIWPFKPDITWKGVCYVPGNLSPQVQMEAEMLYTNFQRN